MTRSSENACTVFPWLGVAAEQASEGMKRFVVAVRKLDERLGMIRDERRPRGAKGMRRATGKMQNRTRVRVRSWSGYDDLYGHRKITGGDDE